MERILLIEPYYQNKFPPLGLMKIATYHRNKGDIVEFYKGEAPYLQIVKANKIYITSLFTFHYDITIKTILHYKKYIHKDMIYIGGIAATLMAQEIEKDTGISNIIQGQLLSSNILGYDDNINIDELPLDYDIIDDITYDYTAGDNYFVYTTRGCPRKCEFCAVRILEPDFVTTNNIINQVRRVDEIYGQKRNLLVMDNNILFSPKISEIVNDIIKVGFNGEKNFIYPNKFKIIMRKIKRRKKYQVDYIRQIYQAMDLIEKFYIRLQHYNKVSKEYLSVIESIKTSENVLKSLEEHEEYLEDMFDKYSSKTKMIRYVDFNQGIDARKINSQIMKQLAKVPINPFRLAYDSVDDTETYKNAFKLAVNNDIKYHSNYMLYNWNDKPEELWNRLDIAIGLFNKHKGIKGFSFPMKYAPFNRKDRNYIGEHWNNKYLGAVNIIINVTKGIVAKEQDFFYKAFGKDENEYFEILTMPDEYIRHREYFEQNGLINFWKELYHELSDEEKIYLIDVLCKIKNDRSILFANHPLAVKKILVLYLVNKNQCQKAEKTFQSIAEEIERINGRREAPSLAPAPKTLADIDCGKA